MFRASVIGRLLYILPEPFGRQDMQGVRLKRSVGAGSYKGRSCVQAEGRSTKGLHDYLEVANRNYRQGPFRPSDILLM